MTGRYFDEFNVGDEFVTQGRGAPGVVDRRFDLPSMPDDPLVLQQARDVSLAESRHALDIEVLERCPECRPLPKDGQPAQARLKPFEADLLEKPAIVDDGLAPLVVVIPHVSGIRAGPPAAGQAIGVTDESFSRRSIVCAHRRFYEDGVEYVVDVSTVNFR